MTTFWQRSILTTGIILSFALTAFAAKEQTLAGVRLGQTENEVSKSLGASPAGKFVAMPPTEVRPDEPDVVAATATPGMAPAGAPVKPPNILVFSDYLSHEDVWIGESTIVITGATTGTTTAQPTPGMGGDGTSGTTTAQVVRLPVWAYSVRTGALALNQEQLIYRINSTYSIGVTFTKKGEEFQATDIVAASFEPLSKFPTKPGQKPTKFNFSNRTAPATSTGATIGTSYAMVLEKHGWAPLCYSFAGSEVSQIKGGMSKSVPVISRGVNSSEGTITVTPEPELYESMPPTVPGSFPIRFTDGKKDTIRAGFSRNCLLLYIDQGVAFTLVNFQVVRIQVGSGVVTPPPTPKPPAPPMMPDGMGGAPGGYQPGIANPGAPPIQQLPAQTDDNPFF